MRVLTEYEVSDGFMVSEKVKFRIPLRGLCTPYLSPTFVNVFNKFTVRYYARLVLKVWKQQIDTDSVNEGGEEHWTTVEGEVIG